MTSLYSKIVEMIDAKCAIAKANVMLSMHAAQDSTLERCFVKRRPHLLLMPLFKLISFNKSVILSAVSYFCISKCEATFMPTISRPESSCTKLTHRSGSTFRTVILFVGLTASKHASSIKHKI